MHFPLAGSSLKKSDWAFSRPHSVRSRTPTLRHRILITLRAIALTLPSMYSRQLATHWNATACRALTDSLFSPREGLKEQSERIRQDDLDVLMVGVNQTITATAAALLGCLRLARTQVATVSSPVTTGLHHMDVMLSAVDNEVHPGAQMHYSEQLWLMNGSVNVYAYQYDNEPATVKFDRSHLQVSAETIVFFSGANFFKIIPEYQRVGSPSGLP